jgi:chemotaxis signal transduction protein
VQSGAQGVRGTGMSDAASSLAGRAMALRREFDQSFVLPLRPEGAAAEDFLAVRIGVEACALRLGEVAGLFADKKITPVLGGGPAQLGIAGFRGAILPVYSLQALFGRPLAEPPRWLVVVAGAPVALGFEAFQGHLRVARDAVLAQQSAERRFHARHYIRAQSLVRPVIDLASVLDALEFRRPQATPKEER